MVNPRLIVGGLTERSVMIGTEGAKITPADIEFFPFTPGIVIEDAGRPQLDGQLTRNAFIAAGLTPGTDYTVRAGPSSNSVAITTLPASLDQGPLRVGFSSCYFPSRQFKTRPAAALACWGARGKYPHVIVHCGDQIYADVPAMSDSLRKHFRQRYESAWAEDQLGVLFSRAGHYFTPDDHEYWNDYPRGSVYLFQSAKSNWRDTGRVAAEAYWSYQGLFNFPVGMSGGRKLRRGWSYGTWSGIPVFITDTRSERSMPDGDRMPESGLSRGGQFMSSTQMSALLDWLGNLSSLGVMVIGQPLAAKTSTTLFGAIVTDYGLHAFKEQFREMMSGIRKALDRGVTVLVLTGDIHWGRLVEWTRAGRGRLLEYVASPIGRVGFRSILSDKYDGGPYKNIEPVNKVDDLAIVTKELIGYSCIDHFATGHNNVGSVVFERSGTNGVDIVMQSFSLEFQSPAPDQWHPPGYCVLRRSVA